ncbi:hypothetical protein [Krasilnikovia sp. MM14-A1004]|uniref:hypothetical protein n=1 Tax=Krasilnikovia sp. MM14-A1004 TaxID=3373541 RepID=UPI00399C7378
MGLFIIVLMIVATVILIRNMNKRIRRLPGAFGDADAAGRDAEIARLDADLRMPAADPVRPGADGGERGEKPDRQPPADGSS